MAIAEWVLTGGLLAGIGYTCDDPAFAPERIEAAVAQMMGDVLGHDAQLVGRPRVDILGVIRARASEDRVVVRVRARSPRGAIDERGTLAHRAARWRLVADAGERLAHSADAT